MKYTRHFLLLCLLANLQVSSAQHDKDAVKAVVNRFFEAMEKGDTTMLKNTCTDTPVFQTYMADKSGEMLIYTENFDEFVRFVGTPTPDKYKEQIKFGAVHVEKSLASVWAPYVFYLNGKVSHCGTDSFQLVKTKQGWKIHVILDTRRKQGCK